MGELSKSPARCKPWGCSVTKRTEASFPIRIPLCIPQVEKEDWFYVKKALESNWVSAVGPDLKNFESLVARAAGRKFAVATNNGTAALHAAFLVLGLGPEDEVLVPTLTFIASVNPIRYTGAWPVFMDSDPDTLQMDVSKTADFLKNKCGWRGGALINRVSGRRVKAIVPVHILGHPVDMDPLMEVAKQYKLTVIEDAAEGLGSVYRGRHVGGLGDIGCFSFNGNKIVTTGGGGMVVTDNPKWAEQIRFLTTQARRRSKEEFIHDEIGYNYRLSNLQAALGLAQMARFPQFLRRKHFIAKTYREGLSSHSVFRVFKDAPWCHSNSWLSAVFLPDGSSLARLKRVQCRLALQGVETRRLWKPVHQQRPYRNCQTHRLEWAERLHDRVLCLPSSVGLSLDDQNRVISALNKCV